MSEQQGTGSNIGTGEKLFLLFLIIMVLDDRGFLT